MKAFFTKYKPQIIAAGVFAIGVIILLTLSFGEQAYDLN